MLVPRVAEQGEATSGEHAAEYVQMVGLNPFYRIWFQDGSYFDYTGDKRQTEGEVTRLSPTDLEGYRRFHDAAEAIFQRGFLQLGYTGFFDVRTMLKVAPDLFRLDAVRSLFGFVSRYFKSPKLRTVFSYETLLVGGNPQSVPAIYAMIHFVEKTWGIHWVTGGTGELVAGFARKFEELGGTIQRNAEVTQIEATPNGGWWPLRRRGRVTGVRLKDGEVLPAEVVVSNADYARTYGQLLAPQFRRWHADWRWKRNEVLHVGGRGVLRLREARGRRPRPAAPQHHHGAALRRAPQRHLRAPDPGRRLQSVPARAHAHRRQPSPPKGATRRTRWFLCRTTVVAWTGARKAKGLPTRCWSIWSPGASFPTSANGSGFGRSSRQTTLSTR